MKRNHFTFYVSTFGICTVLVTLHFFGILAPIERPLSRVVSLASGFISTLRRSADREYIQYQHERDKELQSLCNREYQENKELRSLLILKEHAIPQPVFAAVIGFKDFLGRGRMLIDRGSTDDIHEGMAVITADQKLIGTIGSISQATSEVILLSDDASSIIASIHKADAELLGIVHGSYRISALLEYVQNSSPLEKGDVILTSSLNMVIPPGIIIGTVQNITSNQNDVFQKATILPAVKYEMIRYVAIVKK